jgi:hypothetical protein
MFERSGTRRGQTSVLPAISMPVRAMKRYAFRCLRQRGGGAEHDTVTAGSSCLQRWGIHGESGQPACQAPMEAQNHTRARTST